MRQVRRGVFETNSSSTHSLSMTNQYINDTEFDDFVFEKSYIIKPFKENEIEDTMEFITVEHKLRYFLTLYYQTWYDSDNESKINFIKLLKRVFPNAIFSLEFENSYVFEDGEYFFDEYDNPICLKLLDEYTLKKFMLYGIIRFGNRDREEYYDSINRIRLDPNLWSINWSG